MQIGRVVGHAISTVKHPSLKGWRLLVVQLLRLTANPTANRCWRSTPSARASGPVILTNDGAEARKMVKSKNSPVRWW